VGQLAAEQDEVTALKRADVITTKRVPFPSLKSVNSISTWKCQRVPSPVIFSIFPGAITHSTSRIERAQRSTRKECPLGI
jgi:hypothetical protein